MTPNGLKERRPPSSCGLYRLSRYTFFFSLEINASPTFFPLLLFLLPLKPNSVRLQSEQMKYKAKAHVGKNLEREIRGVCMLLFVLAMLAGPN